MNRRARQLARRKSHDPMNGNERNYELEEKLEPPPILVSGLSVAVLEEEVTRGHNAKTSRPSAIVRTTRP